MIVGSALKGWEDGEIDLALNVVLLKGSVLVGLGVLVLALPVEDEASADASEALVGGGRDDVGVIKWTFSRYFNIYSSFGND